MKHMGSACSTFEESVQNEECCHNYTHERSKKDCPVIIRWHIVQSRLLTFDM